MQARVHRVKAGGRVYRYHKVTRAKLPDLPEDHPDFVAAWLAEERKAKPAATAPAKGTVAAACNAYLASAECDGLSDGYRPVIMRHVKAIRDKSKTAILGDLLPRHVAQNVAALGAAPGASRFKAWRKLAKWWLAKGMISTDITEGLRKPAAQKTDGHKEWSHDDVLTFRAHWPIGTPQRMAMELMQWTGARVSDACRLGPQMVSDGLLTFRQAKTKGEVYVPLTRPARYCDEDRADLLKCISGAPHLAWLVTESGKPRTAGGASQWFAVAAREAGLVGLTAHGLRKYRMNRLAEAGAPVLVMQSWVGHATLAEVQRYIQRADRRAAVMGGGAKTLRSRGKH